MALKKNIWLLCAIAFLQGMVFYGPIATLYREAAGVTVLQITIIEGISLALCIVLELPWGILADRIGYKKTLVVCWLLYFLSKIIFWQASSFSGFLTERIILSVVISGMSGCDVSMLFLSCKEGESHKVFGIYNNLSTLGLVIAAFIYSSVVKENYRLAGLLTVFSYAGAALLVFFLKEVRTPERCITNSFEIKDAFAQFRKNKSHLLFLLGIAFFEQSHQIITVFLSQLQYIKSGISPVNIGYIYIVITMVGFGGIGSAQLTEKLGVKRAVFLLDGAAFVACLIMALTCNAILSVLGIAVLRLAYNLFQPLQTELQNRQVVSKNRTTALSVNAVILNGVGIVANIVFGRVAEKSLSGAMLFGALLCTAGCIFFLIWRRSEEKYTGR